ncbi:MAG: DUF4492 domain-containing protein [Muribaculaceae bacterium]|nr:DUF4492 domain-containing protein [Muribaculaceae bacterium]
MVSLKNFFRRVADLYIDGFRNMTIGRSLWLLIIIKLVIFFAVLKLFFFPDVLATHYPDDEARATAVREALASPVE